LGNCTCLRICLFVKHRHCVIVSVTHRFSMSYKMTLKTDMTQTFASSPAGDRAAKFAARAAPPTPRGILRSFSLTKRGAQFSPICLSRCKSRVNPASRVRFDTALVNLVSQTLHSRVGSDGRVKQKRKNRRTRMARSASDKTSSASPSMAGKFLSCKAQRCNMRKTCPRTGFESGVGRRCRASE
jgi:hypothetical protein